MKKIKIKSNFENMEVIPKKYTCDGENINPNLKIENIPNNAKTMVLIVDDPDAPEGVFDHWIMWNIPSQINEIYENNVPKGAVIGKNSFGNHKYVGPCPPKGKYHRYFFKIFAIDLTLDADPNHSKEEILRMIENNIIDHDEIVGIYKRE